MGEFRKYRPYYACNALRFNACETQWYATGNREQAMTRVPEFKSITGTEYGWLLNLFSQYASLNYSSNTTIAGTSYTWGTVIQANYQHFVYLTPFATNDKLSDYSIDDYSITPIGVTHFQRAQYVAKDVNKILYSMSIFNDNVDSYAANDNPTFVADTFYSLVDGNYILLSTEPADWSTNYAGYYKLVPAEDIKVSCIKFRKLMAASSNTSRSYANARVTESNQTGVYALYVSYFLDEEVTIHPGESYLLSLSFESSQF